MNETLSDRIRVLGRELGFAAAGIGPAARLELAEMAIRERVASGRLVDYGFSRRAPEHFTRVDLIVPGARSVITVALAYDSTDIEVASVPPRGRIARFARGRDYHAEVGDRLKSIVDLIHEESPSAICRICVDTGPLIDRAACQLAGIGSYGKNASIITEAAGSWVALGEIVTDVPLIPNEPAPLETCGSCDLCIKVCPAGAIAAPFVIDQTRCISHLTQAKGVIAVEQRELLGDCIYGCDVCQEVCPKNIGKSCDGKGSESGLGGRPELIPLLNIGQEEFDRVVGPTAIGWIGRSRFRRNVAIALGNIGDRSAVSALRHAIADDDPLVKLHAEWALEQLMQHSGCQ